MNPLRRITTITEEWLRVWNLGSSVLYHQEGIHHWAHGLTSQVLGASLSLGEPGGSSQNYENQSDGEVNKCQILHVINTTIDLKTSTGSSQSSLSLHLQRGIH